MATTAMIMTKSKTEPTAIPVMAAVVSGTFPEIWKTKQHYVDLSDIY